MLGLILPNHVLPVPDARAGGRRGGSDCVERQRLDDGDDQPTAGSTMSEPDAPCRNSGACAGSYMWQLSIGPMSMVIEELTMELRDENE